MLLYTISRKGLLMATRKKPAKPSKPTPTAHPRPTATGRPVFNEPGFQQDPTAYKQTHASDTAAYNQLDQLQKLNEFNPMPFRVAAGADEPVLTLAAAYGAN